MNTTKTHTENGSQLDPMYYAQLLLKRKRLFAVLALLVMTVAVVVSYVLPKRYEAKSIVFIEQNVISDLVKGIAITPSMENKIKAIRVTLLSRTMMLELIKALDLDLRHRTDAELDALVESLKSRIDIRLDEEKGVFLISFRDEDPVLARDVVNNLIRIYIEENTSTKRKESFEATQFLADQIETFKDRISAAQEEIDEFKSEAGMILSQDEGRIRMDIESAEAQLESLSMQENQLETTRRVLIQNTPLRSELDARRRQYNSFQARYTPDHPKIIRLKQSIEDLEEQIRDGGAADMQQVYNSPEYQRVRVTLQSLEEQRALVEAELEKKKAMLREMPSVRTRLAELERIKQNEVLIYEKLVGRYGQSEVSKEMELQDKAMTFRVLDPAVVPAMPVSPNRPLIILAGIVAGFGFAAVFIIGLDFLNPTVKSSDYLKDLGVPVLAVVPKIKDLNEEQTQKKSDRRFYLAAGAYFFAVLAVLGVEIIT